FPQFSTKNPYFRKSRKARQRRPSKLSQSSDVASSGAGASSRGVGESLTPAPRAGGRGREAPRTGGRTHVGSVRFRRESRRDGGLSRSIWRASWGSSRLA